MQKIMTALIFPLMLAFLASCAYLSVATPTAVIPTTTQTPLPPFPTRIASPTETNISSPTPLALQTPTSVAFSFSRIWTVPENETGVVLTAFWSQDNSLIYYALVKDDLQIRLWSSLEISDRNNIKEKHFISAPPIIYPPKFPTGGIYEQYRGLVSPSGRYRFRIVSQGDVTRQDNETLFIFDTVQQRNLKVLERPDMDFRGAFWATSEGKVIFGIGPETGTDIFLYDLTKQQLILPDDLIGYRDPILAEWVPSPDGKYIAIIDSSYHLRIFSLEGRSSKIIPGYLFENIRWAGNSKKLYFFYGNEEAHQFLGFYDIPGQTLRNVLELSRLSESIYFPFFDVSPDGNQIIFWRNEGIWLLSLH